MSKDPFDTLENQLRNTVEQRAPRKATRRFNHRSGLALLVAALAGGGAVATATVFRDRPSDVDRALNAGYDAVKDTAACRVRPLPNLRTVKGTATAAPIDRRITRDYAIFRRPRTAADKAVNPRFAFYGGTVLRDSVRAAVAADGARFELAISQGTPRLAQTHAISCAKAARAAAIAHVPATNTTLRAHVARIMDGRLASIRASTGPLAQQLSFASHSRFNKSGSSGSGDIRNGHLGTVGGYRQDGHGNRRFITFYGLVPDPVKTIRLIDQAGPIGQRAGPVTVRVHDNVYDIALPKRMGPKTQLTWLAANGRTIKVLHPSF